MSAQTEYNTCAICLKPMEMDEAKKAPLLEKIKAKMAGRKIEKVSPKSELEILKCGHIIHRICLVVNNNSSVKKPDCVFCKFAGKFFNYEGAMLDLNEEMKKDPELKAALKAQDYALYHGKNI